jgi:hypothetical protein
MQLHFDLLWEGTELRNLAHNEAVNSVEVNVNAWSMQGLTRCNRPSKWTVSYEVKRVNCHLGFTKAAVDRMTRFWLCACLNAGTRVGALSRACAVLRSFRCPRSFTIFGVPIFTPEERERLRAELVSAARNDPNISGAAHTGSAVSSRLDRWSDIDLALCVKSSYEQVVAEWTDRLCQRHGAVAHVDVMRGATLFRVFLLENTLQVDIAFWRAQEFGAIGPNFQLIFGEPNPPQPSPQPNAHPLIGMAWLYALHVRSSLVRGRLLQAEYMLSGMRNHVFELACLRCGVIAYQGRGLDELPPVVRNVAAACIPQSLDPAVLKRAFQKTMEMLLDEIRHVDSELERRAGTALQQIAESWVL